MTGGPTLSRSPDREAADKWCPFARGAYYDPRNGLVQAVNRDVLDTPLGRCLREGCAVWTGEWCGRIHPMERR